MRYSILAALVLCVAAWADLPIDPDTDAVQEAWEIVCTIQDKYSCDDVDPPVVRLMDDPAWKGGYSLEGEAHINLGYARDDLEGVAFRVHEMLHHLDFTVGGTSVRSQKQLCDSENFAYTNVNRWLEQEGREDLQIHKWWESQEGHRGYWRCLPWYPGIDDFVVSEPSFGPGDDS